MTMLAVLAVVLSVGVPMMRVFFQSNRMISNTNEIVSGLHIARSEAIRTQMRVTMCQSGDRASCTGTGRWEDGFIVFQDPNGNNTVDGGERLLRVNTGADGAGVTIRSDDANNNNRIQNSVSFSSRGVPKTLNGIAMTGVFRVCDDRGLASSDNVSTVARGVLLGASGRVRTTKALSKIPSCP